MKPEASARRARLRGGTPRKGAPERPSGILQEAGDDERSAFGLEDKREEC